MQNRMMAAERCDAGTERADTVTVAVGVVTYRRPRALERSLASLRNLEGLDEGAELVAVIVVDNDPAGSARDTVEAERPQFDVPLRYAVESEPGIAAARNAVIDLASDCRLLAFIDDDEVATPGWLRRMVALQQRSGAELVAGPTVSVMPDNVPRWLEDGRQFERSRRQTGSTFRFAGSGNLLLDLVGCAPLAPLFDLRYGILGGSDTHLFIRARNAGLGMLWCDEAVVFEDVPQSRTRLSWILKRAYRAGNTVALCERELAVGFSGHARVGARCAKALIRMGQGVIEALVAVAMRDRGGCVGGLRRIVNAAGMMAGSLDLEYAEYRRKSNDLHIAPLEAAAPSNTTGEL